MRENEISSENTCDSSVNIKDPKPSEIHFNAESDWVMKLTHEGVFFNREKFSASNPDDFALAVIGILENRFDVMFNKKEPPYDK